MFWITGAKPNKGIILGGLVLFFCLLLNSAFALGGRPPKKDTSKSTAITGHITDKISVQPIVGASVKMFDIRGRSLGVTVSDSFGNYILINTYATANYFFNISAVGYNTTLVLRLVKVKESNIFNFVLTPQASTPKIISLLPSDHSIFAIGENVGISVTTSIKDKFQYRYSLDERIIQDWCNAATFTFNPDTQERGRHILKVEVKNAKGELDSQSVTIYIVRAFSKPED